MVCMCVCGCGGPKGGVCVWSPRDISINVSGGRLLFLQIFALEGRVNHRAQTRVEGR